MMECVLARLHASGRGILARVLFAAALTASPTNGLADDPAQAPSPMQEKPVVFVCPRCGCAGDSRLFDAPGKCPDCQMGLVRQEGQRRARSVAFVVCDEM